MFRKHRLGRAGLTGLCAALCIAACSDNGNNGPIVDPGPWDPVAVGSYSTKVKNLLTGLPLTDAELQALTADPNQLPTYIDQWMALPQFEPKLLDFFKQAFQQTQINFNNFADQLGGNLPQGDGATFNHFTQSAQESFARTVLQLMKEGKPFTEVVTTNRYMLNPPLMAWIAWHDSQQRDDKNKLTNRYPNTFSYSWTPNPIPIDQSLTPGNANYLKFTLPSAIPATQPAQCMGDVTVTSNASSSLNNFLWGSRNPNITGVNGCGTGQPIWTAADFDSWKMVTIRPANAGEPKTDFFDIVKFRNGSELVVSSPRLGFFSTPAFYANWPTNTSNQHRVTVNQTTIVALGRSFEDTINAAIPTIDTTTADTSHAGMAPCSACHVALDPMRQFFRQTYTLTYNQQLDQAQISIPATFAFDGEVKPGMGIGDLASNLATHPRFAVAWVDKLCYFANGVGCDETDPEFVRVVDDFRANNFDFKRMMRTILSSPLVTLATRTKTFGDKDQPVSIARLEHLCPMLSNRLGLPDICGQGLILTATQTKAATLALSVPASSYSRGGEAPVMTQDPNLFFRAATENLCVLIAPQVVDAAMMSKYQSTAPDTAIEDFVVNIMGFPPSDPRYAGGKQALQAHFDLAKTQTGAKVVDALRSTFTLACSSAITTSLGL